MQLNSSYLCGALSYALSCPIILMNRHDTASNDILLIMDRSSMSEYNMHRYNGKIQYFAY